MERSPYKKLLQSVTSRSIQEVFPSPFIDDVSVTDLLNSLVEDMISKENLKRVWNAVEDFDLDNERLQTLAGFVELDKIVEVLDRKPIQRIEKILLGKVPGLSRTDEVLDEKRKEAKDDWEKIINLAKRLIIMGTFLSHDQDIGELYVRKVNKNGTPVKYRVPLIQPSTSLTIAVNSYIEESLLAALPALPEADTRTQGLFRG